MKITIIVKWVTMKPLNREQKRVLPIIREMWIDLLKEFKIRRTIALYIVDDDSWLLKTGLNMHTDSVAHHNDGIKFGGRSAHEAVLLREGVIYWKDARTAVPKILRHELVHAKLKGREAGNEHGKLFHATAKNYGRRVAKEGDY